MIFQRRLLKGLQNSQMVVENMIFQWRLLKVLQNSQTGCGKYISKGIAQSITKAMVFMLYL